MTTRRLAVFLAVSLIGNLAAFRAFDRAGTGLSFWSTSPPKFYGGGLHRTFIRPEAPEHQHAWDSLRAEAELRRLEMTRELIAEEPDSLRLEALNAEWAAIHRGIFRVIYEEGRKLAAIESPKRRERHSRRWRYMMGLDRSAR